MDRNYAWPDTKLDQAKKLFAEGLSFGQIAKQIGGVSRNAVIGKMHRLGFRRGARMSDVVLKQRQRRRKLDRVRVVEAVVRPAKIPTLRGELAEIAALAPLEPLMTLTERTPNVCRYIFSDPKQDTIICGRATVDDYPWCCAHRRLVYQADDSKRKRDVVRQWSRFSRFADRNMVSEVAL